LLLERSSPYPSPHKRRDEGRERRGSAELGLTAAQQAYARVDLDLAETLARAAQEAGGGWQADRLLTELDAVVPAAAAATPARAVRLRTNNVRTGNRCRPAGDAGDADGSGLLGGRFRVTGALQFSNSGGVYTAEDTADGDRRVVLKEARPHTNVNPRRGYDAVDILAREWTFLNRLADAGPFPNPVAAFRHWEHQHDLYSLATVMAYFIFPIAAMSYLREDVFDVYRIFTDSLGWPARIHGLLADLAQARITVTDALKVLEPEAELVDEVKAVPSRPAAEARPSLAAAEARLGLAAAETGVAAFVEATADTDRDTLFPVDPFAHVTNPLSLGFGRAASCGRWPHPVSGSDPSGCLGCGTSSPASTWQSTRTA
jgi:hypothetical protein